MTNSTLDVRRGAQTPRVGRWPSYVSSAGTEAAELAASVGLHLDPWQRYVLEHGLGETADGQWAARKVSCWVPRQNGKGAVIEARTLAGLFLFGEKLILHSAHEYKTSAEAFLRLRSLIDGSDDLRRRVHRVHQANGEEGIELTRAAGGGRLRFIARSKGSGRGFTGWLNILDEAQELTAAQMAAILPTMSAVANPQIWYFGTPPSDPGAWVYGLRADGEAGVDRMAHFDWGADLNLGEPADVRRGLADVDLWYACNPALGQRISEEFVRDEATPSGLGDQFLVERLGVWPPRAADGPSVLDLAAWQALTDEASRREGDVAFSLDVTPSRDAACIAVYGLRADGLGHVEIVDHRAGTDWVVERLVELRERWDPVAIALDTKGPAGSLIVPLEKVGITRPENPDKPQRGDLAIPTAQEVAAACGQLVDAITQATIRHIGQELIETAIRGAKTRPLGDAWAWGRRVSSADISPIVAVTLARWAYESRAHLVSDDDDYDALDSVL
ncbi:hypothetical protein [Microtetraspora malaysiensis]|uniref:hypothetical protein n=1 Tax=Microtetraspora malaysiensis TaxID=161358 RepID=UPI003D8F9367